MVGRSVFVLAVFIAALSLLADTTMAGDSPRADFDVDSYKIMQEDDHRWKTYVDEEIVLSAGRSTDATTFRWDLGEGHVEETDRSTIAHTYYFTGNYKIELEVEDDEGNTDSCSGIVTIIDRPAARLVLRDGSNSKIIDPEETTIPVWTEVILDASGSEGEILMYHFGIDLHRVFLPQALRETPYYRFSYSVPGTYDIGLRVVDSFGNRSQLMSEEFIRVRVSERSSSSGSETREQDSMGGLTGLLIFAGVLGLFIMAFKKRSVSDTGWAAGKGGGSPNLPESERVPFFFKNIREQDVPNYTQAPAVRRKASFYESTITDRRDTPSIEDSVFRKH